MAELDPVSEPGMIVCPQCDERCSYYRRDSQGRLYPCVVCPFCNAPLLQGPHTDVRGVTRGDPRARRPE